MESKLRASARRNGPVKRFLARSRAAGVSRVFYCALLGVLLLNCSCSKDSELARVKAAAKRGDPEAQFQLGAYYHDGPGLAPDYEAAAAWFARAAQQGHTAAQFALGKMLLNAEGVLPDEMQAANWIRKAAEQGYAPAQDELARMYSNGTGVMADHSEAVKWATQAAEQGSPDAQYFLGCLLSSGAPSGTRPDKVAACFWLGLAAAEGHLESEELLGQLKAQLTPEQAAELNRRNETWKKQQKKSAGAPDDANTNR